MFNGLIIAYLFLGGMGSGACFVLGCLGLHVPKRVLVSDDGKTMAPPGAFQRFFGLGYVVCSMTLVLGALCLLADLERPENILTLVVNPHLSVVSIGAYSLALLLACSALLSFAWLTAVRIPFVVARIVQIASLAASLVVMVYTALLLNLFAGIEFWRSPFVLLLFMLSSFSTGIACIVLVMTVFRVLGQFAVVARNLMMAERGVVVFETVVLAVFVSLGVFFSDDVAPYEAMLVGSCSLAFWAGLVVCGVIVPLGAAALDAVRLRSSRVRFVIHPGISALCIVAGGVCLRYCVVMAVV